MPRPHGWDDGAVPRGRSRGYVVTSQERRDRGGYLRGMGQGQGMASTGEHHFLGVWQPGQDELANLREPWPARGPAEVENRLRDVPCVAGAETPGQQRRQISGEEGAGIVFGLRHCVREVSLDVAPPVRSDDCRQEPAERRRRAMQPVVLDELAMNGSLGPT